jgi:hypothetical protein
VSMCGLVVDVCVGVCSDVIFVVLEFLIPFFLFNMKDTQLSCVIKKKSSRAQLGSINMHSGPKDFTALEQPKQPQNPVTIALLTVLHKCLAGSSLTPRSYWCTECEDFPL